MGRACSKNVYRILVGKPEGKKPLGRPRCRWVDNTKIRLRDKRYDNKVRELATVCLPW
jgi:hypothetical protein